MSDFQQSLADILTDTPERLVLSKQVSRSQEYRKVVIEKKERLLSDRKIYRKAGVPRELWRRPPGTISRPDDGRTVFTVKRLVRRKGTPAPDVKKGNGNL